MSKSNMDVDQISKISFAIVSDLFCKGGATGSSVSITTKSAVTPHSKSTVPSGRTLCSIILLTTMAQNTLSRDMISV